MGIVRINNLLRSSLVKTCEKGESWRARASDSIGSVQARTVGITSSGVDRVVADKAQTHYRAWNGSSLLKNRNRERPKSKDNG